MPDVRIGAGQKNKVVHYVPIGATTNVSPKLHTYVCTSLALNKDITLHTAAQFGSVLHILL